MTGLQPCKEGLQPCKSVFATMYDGLATLQKCFCNRKSVFATMYDGLATLQKCFCTCKTIFATLLGGKSDSIELNVPEQKVTEINLILLLLKINWIHLPL